MSRLSLRELQNRPVRSLLTLLSIIIGAGAIISTSLSTSSARLAQKAMVDAVTGNASLEIQSVGGGSMDAKQVAFLRDVPGIEIISPAIRRYSTMTVMRPSHDSATSTESNSEAENRPQKFRVQLLGVNMLEDQRVRKTRIVAGSDPFAPTPNHQEDESNPQETDRSSNHSDVWIDEGFAQSAKIEVGQEIQLLTKSGIQNARIAGWIHSDSASSAFQAALLVAPLRVVQRWTRSPGKLDLIQIILQDEKKLVEIQSAIQSQLPEGVTVRPPSLRSEMASESTFAIQRGLLLATIFSLIMATFIIFNTFQMNIGERRRQLGILRAVGATRKQILHMVLREAAIMGVLGSILGCFAGYFGASILNRSTSTLLQIDIPRSQIEVLPVLLAIVGGVLVSLLGAAIPAFMASVTSPSDAMKAVSDAKIRVPWSAWFLVGCVLIAIGAYIQFISAMEYINVQFGTAGIVNVVLGVMLLLPASLPLLTRIAGAPLMLLFPTETRLARKQILRHPGRSAMTIGIMLVAMSMGLGMASTIFDNIRDVQSWYRRTVVGDFFIRAAMPDMSSGHAADMPDGFVEKVRRVDGVQMVDTIRFVSARSGESSIIVVVREFTSDSQDYFDLIRGTDAEVMKGIRAGQVVIGSVLSERLQLTLGDSIEIETNQGKTRLQIAGVTNEYLAGGLTVYMAADQAKTLLSVEGTDAVVINADPAKIESMSRSLEQLSEKEGLMFQSLADMGRIIENMINGVVGGLWVVLAMGALIAAFGLINTLAMNILEQTREIGMLRVIAMTRWQIRKMILAQALIMSLIGVVPGVLLGVAIASVINFSTMVVTGHAVRFQFYPEMMLAAVVFELAVVIVAALFPAERAARLHLASALQYE
ncbi:MAG: FtsX-like permease family protein [Planctomycetota bacterium]